MLVTPTADAGDLAHPVHSLARVDGRVVRYLDTGERGWHAVVFFGGLGTSARAFALTEFARAEREDLQLRFISVERNGFGATPFGPGLGFADAVDDVLAVLAALGVNRFSVVAISGGGPYAARLVARAPARVASLHLAAATTGGALLMRGATADFLRDVEAIVRDPAAFWEYPPASPVRDIPGFVGAARMEGRYALGDPARAAAALSHELALLSGEELPDLHELQAPAFLYWGAADELVSLRHARVWQARLGPATIMRIYLHAGHDVQYLHWREILRDIAGAPR